MADHQVKASNCFADNKCLNRSPKQFFDSEELFTTENSPYNIKIVSEMSENKTSEIEKSNTDNQNLKRFHTHSVFISSLIILAIVVLTVQSLLQTNSTKNQSHLGNFYLDIQSKPRDCIRLHNRLGEYRIKHSSNVQHDSSSMITKPNDYQAETTQASLPYCQKLFNLFRQCFIQSKPSSNLIGSQYSPVSPSANQKASYHPNIFLILSNPRAERPYLFQDLFLTHFLQNYQIKLNRTIRHAPTISCHSFISAYDLQDRSDRTNSIIVYGPLAFGVHSILPKTKPYIYILWVENPISRLWRLFLGQKASEEILSKYSFGPHDRILHEMTHSQNMSQVLFYSNFSQNPYIDNYLTRLLSFDLSSPNASCSSGTEDCIFSTNQNIEKYSFTEIDQSHFEAAVQAIQSHSVLVALAEEPEASLKRICSHFNLTAFCFGKSALRKLQKNLIAHEKNLSEEEREIFGLDNPEILAELENRNYWDLKLYKHITKLFEEQRRWNLQPSYI